MNEKLIKMLINNVDKNVTEKKTLIKIVQKKETIKM